MSKSMWNYKYKLLQLWVTLGKIMAKSWVELQVQLCKIMGKIVQNFEQKYVELWVQLMELCEISRGENMGHKHLELDV